MKNIFFALLATAAVLSTAACAKTENNDEILVRFRNALSTPIQSAQMDVGEGPATNIGLIPAGATTDYIPFSYFLEGDGFPMGTLKGQINGADFSAWSGMWCGTGVTFQQLSKGVHTIVIVETNADDPMFRYIFRLD